MTFRFKNPRSVNAEVNNAVLRLVHSLSLGRSGWARPRDRRYWNDDSRGVRVLR